MSLNPYCSGQWSRTFDELNKIRKAAGVLILIVVDNGLVQLEKAVDRVKQDVLILIVVDNGFVLRGFH